MKTDTIIVAAFVAVALAIEVRTIATDMKLDDAQRQCDQLISDSPFSQLYQDRLCPKYERKARQEADFVAVAVALGVFAFVCSMGWGGSTHRVGDGKEETGAR